MLFEFCFAFDVSKSEFLDVLVAYENPLDAWCEAETILELEGIVSAYIYTICVGSLFLGNGFDIYLFLKVRFRETCTDAQLCRCVNAEEHESCRSSCKNELFHCNSFLIMCFSFKCSKYSVLLSNGKISQRMSIKILPNGESASQNE